MDKLKQFFAFILHVVEAVVEIILLRRHWVERMPKSQGAVWFALFIWLCGTPVDAFMEPPTTYLGLPLDFAQDLTRYGFIALIGLVWLLLVRLLCRKGNAKALLTGFFYITMVADGATMAGEGLARIVAASGAMDFSILNQILQALIALWAIIVVSFVVATAMRTRPTRALLLVTLWLALGMVVDVLVQTRLLAPGLAG